MRTAVVPRKHKIPKKIFILKKWRITINRKLKMRYC